jgi:photosystem II stability/assembly factor-like uncharacterized protein
MARTRLRRAALALTLLLAGTGHAEPVGTDGAWIVTRPGNPWAGYPAVFDDGTAYVWMDAERSVFKSTDGGLTWTPMPSVPGAWIALFGSPTTGYQRDGGDCYGCPLRLHRTTDGARTWQPAAALPAPPRGHVESFAPEYAVAPGGRTVLVAGGWHRRTALCQAQWEDHQEIFVSRDGARSWRRGSLPAKGWVRRISMADDRNGAIWMQEVTLATAAPSCRVPRVGETPSKETLWVTGDGGLTWRRAAMPCAYPDCQSMTMVTSRRIVVGDDDSVHVSDDRGRTFRAVRLPTTVEQPGVFDLAFATAFLGYAVTYGQGIWRTLDGGRTWVMEPSPNHAQVLGWYRVAATVDHAVAVTADAVLTRVPARPDQR